MPARSLVPELPPVTMRRNTPESRGSFRIVVERDP
jgi:hypothetical protein